MQPVVFRCDASAAGIPLPHIWEHTVGSGHAPLALRADYRMQLARCHRELGFRHVRFHGLLSDGMGTLVCERDALVYSFFNADQIWDWLLSLGMRPFVELGFMPTTLASGGTTVFHYQGNVTPPRRYADWFTLIQLFASHCVARYGADEVRQWFFEVWNEPNLNAFWTGSQQDYFELYRQTALALKTVDASLRVGGPATADNAWIAEFLDFGEAEGVPPDFISTHHYPTDAFGKPGDDTESQLADSTRSALRDEARRVHALARGRPVYYTEWNTSSNSRDPLHDEPYAAAVIVKTMLEATGLAAGYSFWTFSDIFEENYFSSVPFHGGFGLLDIYGIAKPSYRAFEVLHQLGTELIASMSNVHSTVDGWAIRGPAEQGLTVVLTNHALPRHPISTERVCVHIDRVAPPHALTVRRIDASHANPKSAWLAMGAPAYPSPRQVEALHAASDLVWEPLDAQCEGHTLHVELDLPPHAVAAVTLQAGPARDGPA